MVAANAESAFVMRTTQEVHVTAPWICRHVWPPITRSVTAEAFVNVEPVGALIRNSKDPHVRSAPPALESALNTSKRRQAPKSWNPTFYKGGFELEMCKNVFALDCEGEKKFKNRSVRV